MLKTLIISHGNAISGAIDRFEDYLIRQNYEVYKVQHPLDNYDKNLTRISHQQAEIKTYRRVLLPILNYLIDIVLSLITAKRTRPQLMIGANNIDSYTAILANRILYKNSVPVIFFASDYAENRFSSKILNYIYLVIEKAANRSSDLVISNTKRAERRRMELGLTKERSIVIPNGIYIANAHFPKKEIDKKAFVYVGMLNNEHGLLDFLRIYTKEINFLDVIGEGPDLSDLIELCNKHKINLTHHGKQPQSYVHSFLNAFKGLGLAPYKPTRGYTTYGSSMKISEYISYGIPVVTSMVTEQAAEIKQKGYGIVYDKLDRVHIQKSIKAFDTQDFELKARAFYEKNNFDFLYNKIPISQLLGKS